MFCINNIRHVMYVKYPQTQCWQNWWIFPLPVMIISVNFPLDEATQGTQFELIYAAITNSPTQKENSQSIFSKPWEDLITVKLFLSQWPSPGIFSKGQADAGKFVDLRKEPILRYFMNENVQNICGILRIQVEHGIREMDFPGSPQIRSWNWDLSNI